VIAFVFRRARWVLLVAGVRYVARKGVTKSVDEAAIGLEERLPDHIIRVANALPGDAVRVGAAATVAGRAAKRTGLTVRRTGSSAARLMPRSVPRPTQQLGDRLARIQTRVRQESEPIRRELKSEYARYVDGESAALDALLDRRDVEADPLPELPPAVRRGRFRFRRQLSGPSQPRVQRTYRQHQNSWDRPGSRR